MFLIATWHRDENEKDKDVRRQGRGIQGPLLFGVLYSSSWGCAWVGSWVWWCWAVGSRSWVCVCCEDYDWESLRVWGFDFSFWFSLLLERWVERGGWHSHRSGCRDRLSMPWRWARDTAASFTSPYCPSFLVSFLFFSCLFSFSFWNSYIFIEKKVPEKILLSESQIIPEPWRQKKIHRHRPF